MEFYLKPLYVTVQGSGPEREALKKKVVRMFKDLGFKIEVEHSIKSTDFLDVVMDLTTGTYRPFRKEGDEISFIHVDSNHSKNVIKSIPKMVEQRISRRSSNKQIFEEAIGPYQEAINKSGHKYKLEYQPQAHQQRKKKKKKGRKILWFNPPFNAAVKTNMGKLFFDLIDKHFKPNEELNKLFNRNNVKLSYRTTKNIQRHIDSHNKKLLRGNKDEDLPCNCTRATKEKNGGECILQGNCRLKGMVYGAKVTEEKPPERNNNQAIRKDTIKTYTGQTQRSFKERWYAHSTSFNPNKQGVYNGATQSELAAHVCKLKQENKNFSIKWSMIRRASPYSIGQRQCDLCAWEKTYINLANENESLNSRSELITKCMREKDFKLINFLPP